MPSINWNQLAEQAANQTNSQFASQIANLTSMSTTEITSFIQESAISNANAIKVLQEIDHATNSNSQKANAIANIQNGIGFLVSIATKVV
ncbi:hypothetical protein [Pseudofulvibacter geojedonensis]|uniref:Uncharacterized protein n=1 Tax=Pseudofulvibacter geojedonensis TaxID=1123758 RepID=A0ABW3I3S8_9FLAO